LLNSITCEKLIETPLKFNKGLNAVVGADDAHNSIGKSSILMLIDFSFGGSDFPIKCDDVIRNVGHFKVGIEFEFDKIYSFIRDTNDPKLIYDITEQKHININEFTSFLKRMYFPTSNEISFRECVSGFFRIYQRNNYDDQRPLDIVSKETWDAIRRRFLKLYDKYSVIADLEKDKSVQLQKSKDISGTFNTGAVRKINKTLFGKNTTELEQKRNELEEIRGALSKNVTDIQSIINERSFALKKDKDLLVEHKLDLASQFARLESNLNGNKIRNSKSFQAVIEYFPDINIELLDNVEGFHKGLSKILRSQLKKEKVAVEESLLIARNEISNVDKELLRVCDSEDQPVYLLERLIELDRSERDLSQQNDYYEQNVKIKGDIKDTKKNIEEKISSSIDEIELLLNSGMKKYIEQIYLEKPILPTISFGKSDYKFDHGDDRGTGKGFANMISLDLTNLEKTALPCLIHDSLLFKNMDVPAVEQLIKLYSSFEKQIFISIDEVSKYQQDVINIIEKSKFLKLDRDRLAFGIKWKQNKN
jgi:hypothetical protein